MLADRLHSSRHGAKCNYIFSLKPSLPNSSLSESTDLFDKLARQTSTCLQTRDEGGEIGWIDNPYYQHSTNSNSADAESIDKPLNEAVSEIISDTVIKELFKRRVKGGDVFKIPKSSTDNNSTADTTVIQGWHILRVDDLHLRPIITDDTTSSFKNIRNRIRPKLKGSGVVPLSPSFTKLMDENNKSRDEDKTIYTVPNAKHYKIVTTGCQMNVADSERIMGVLEGELGLTSLDDEIEMDTSLIVADDKMSVSNNRSSGKKKTPDILLLNTCTIRDHAEQKVYDALGPYAAMKRAGKPLAIVVAGCVAQQEGEF